MCVLKALKVMFGAFYFLISLLLSSYLADQQLHRGDIVRTLADDSTVVSAESAESTTEESKAALRASWRVGTCADVPGTGLAGSSQNSGYTRTGAMLRASATMGVCCESTQ